MKCIKYFQLWEFTSGKIVRSNLTSMNALMTDFLELFNDAVLTTDLFQDTT
jgi:hypothetical protein